MDIQQQADAHRYYAHKSCTVIPKSSDNLSSIATSRAVPKICRDSVLQLQRFCASAAGILCFSCRDSVLQLQGFCASVAGILCFSCRDSVLQLQGFCASVVGILCFGCRDPVLQLQGFCASVAGILCFSCRDSVLQLQGFCASVAGILCFSWSQRLRMTRTSSGMFNNISEPWLPTAGTPAPEFQTLVSCYQWFSRNKTLSVAQVDEVCSLYEDIVRLGTGGDLIFWLTGLLIIIGNAAVLWGIIGTQELRTPLYFYYANLAMSDVLAGIGLLYRTAGYVGYSRNLYLFILNFVSLMTFSQIMSASALSVLSVNSYVGLMYPVFYRNHNKNGNTKRLAGLVLAGSWIGYSLLVFSPSMGWNCLQMGTLTNGNCIANCPVAFVVICVSILFLLCCNMLFTNISLFIAIRKREKRRLEQATSDQNREGGTQQNNVAQDKALQKFRKNVHKARTVMIHVVVSFACWLLAAVLVVLCVTWPDMCPSNQSSVYAATCLNSAINPVATLIRTPDLRKAIWRKLRGIYRVFVTLIRRLENRMMQQEELPGQGNAPDLQGDQVENIQDTCSAGEHSASENRGCVIQAQENIQDTCSAGEHSASENRGCAIQDNHRLAWPARPSHQEQSRNLPLGENE
ncbi:uncharacterized protein LOC118430512 [Branchiostoma floridae]|uniref:Uncharacterized protein LOC118430512 n=1 Tax=Branchiostoma floridae TaxID=7739 RepID=A0A9J7MA07_BRAFL|nr:uncharacterized protein LOC118430512 [Branchiostoma floridae]